MMIVFFVGKTNKRKGQPHFNRVMAGPFGMPIAKLKLSSIYF